MKNYEEITNDLLERRDRYITEQKKKRKRVISVAAPICCFCLASLLGIGVWNSGMLTISPITSDYNNTISQNHGEGDNPTPGNQAGEQSNPPANSQRDDPSNPGSDIPSGNNPSQQDQPTNSNPNIDKFADNGLMVPAIMMWEGNIYIASSENQLTVEDLDQLITNSYNINQTAYSIKNVPSTEHIAYKANGKVYNYKCIYSAPLIVNGKDYYFVERSVMDVSEFEIGEYIDTVDGMPVYQSTKYENAVYVDIRSVINFEADISIYYVAKAK